jgi:hypothetical protein
MSYDATALRSLAQSAIIPRELDEYWRLCGADRWTCKVLWASSPPESFGVNMVGGVFGHIHHLSRTYWLRSVHVRL